MPATSSTLPFCPYPIVFDTYRGCSHGCRYCFVNGSGRRIHGRPPEPFEGADALRSWIDGHRGPREAWADWDIPIAWGRVSDPFQPIEREKRASLRALEVLAETRYPFIVTTKSTLPAEEPYRSLLARCVCVFQMSLACPAHDKWEPGAPPFSERLAALRSLHGIVTRTIARTEPVFAETLPAIIREVPRFAEAGAWAVLADMAHLKRPAGLCREERRGTWYYPAVTRDSSLLALRTAAHRAGLVFLTGGSVNLSDSPCCCGTDGLAAFVPNTFNARHLAMRPQEVCVTPRMRCDPGCAVAFHNVRRDRFTDGEERRTFESLMWREIGRA